jgi:hypothetical protein
MDFLEYINQVRDYLLEDPDVLGLITVGSTADPTYRDQWSDHDFWIIAAPGSPVIYRDNVNWLPCSESILLSAPHEPIYQTVIYKNRHKVEYAVFDKTEIAKSKLERFQILIDRGGIADLARMAADDCTKKRLAVRSRQCLIENLAILIWTGHQRVIRGELLSAHQYLTGFSVDLLLELLVVHGMIGHEPTTDSLDSRRRIEQLQPHLATNLNRIVELPLIKIGFALMSMAEELLRSKTPMLAWDSFSVVREWICDTSRNA